jgi:hypothetical protein
MTDESQKHEVIVTVVHKEPFRLPGAMAVLMVVISCLFLGQCAAKAETKTEPYSCQMLREAEKKCATNTIGPCYVQSEVTRLRKQCIRDGGRP